MGSLNMRPIASLESERMCEFWLTRLSSSQFKNSPPRLLAKVMRQRSARPTQASGMKREAGADLDLDFRDAT
ncbi:MAG: hypothetical protein ACI8W8_004034 [Rhodothermales bacterium]|jgi:hypothetical protein